MPFHTTLVIGEINVDVRLAAAAVINLDVRLATAAALSCAMPRCPVAHYAGPAVICAASTA